VKSVSKIWGADTFKWFILSLIAGVTVTIVCLVYGLIAATFPLALLLFFFVLLFAFALNALVQAGANPGLREMKEQPDFWLSSIYNAWLYVHDKESWAGYASLFSFLLAVPLGSLSGGAILVMKNVSSSILWASWLAGIFLLFSIAMVAPIAIIWWLEI